MIQKNVPKGGMEKDSDLHTVSPFDFTDARNIRNGYGSTINAVENAKGNVEVARTLPPGDDKAIGTLEDKDSKSIIAFTHNSGNSHSISRFWPDDVSGDPNGRTETLIQSSVLGFEEDWLIHSAKIVDGKYLHWVDGKSKDEGNEPRKLNLEKLSIYNKQLSYTLFFGDESFPVGRQYQIQIKEHGTITTPTEIFYTVPAGPPSVTDTIQAVADALNAGGYDLVATVSGNSVIIVHDTAYFTIKILGVLPNVVQLSPLNHYDTYLDLPQIQSQQFTIIKPVPPCPPQPAYSVDSGVNQNRVYNRSFKFRYQYVFDDGEVSAWGSSSYVPTNFGSTLFTLNMEVTNSESYNKIIVTLPDTLLASYQWRGIIIGINLAVQFEDNDVWRKVDFYPNEQLFFDTLEIEFFNDKTYPVIPSDDAGSEDVQALKNFDFVPRNAMSIESIADESGNYMLSMLGCKEYYDTPKIKATVEVDTDGPLPSPFPANQTKINHSLKNGGIYRVGAIYEDFWGRQCSVAPLGRINVPFGQQVPLLNHLKITFLSDPPSWAWRYKVVISENQNQSIFVQAPAWNVYYCRYGASTDEIDFTTYVADDADFVAFRFSKDEIPESYLNTIFDQDLINNTGNIFLPEPMDRMQILSWLEYDDVDVLDIEDYNYSIIGYNLTKLDTADTEEYFYVFIKFESSQPDFSSQIISAAIDHYLIEIYRPGNETSDKIYYELGPCHDVVESAHQNPLILSQWGDTVNTFKRYTDTTNNIGAAWDKVNVPWVQRNKLHDDTNFVMGDFGRAVVYDQDLKEEFFRGRIRSSDIYKPSTSFNGLNAFRGTNYITINNDFGVGRKLVRSGNVLLAICEFKTQSIYIGKDRTLDLAGNTFLGRSQKLFNLANEFQRDLGTMNPESVIEEEGRVYCYDAYKGVVWRYSSGAGQHPISEEGMRNHFLNTAKQLTIQETPGGFQREFATYYLMIDGDVIGFQEKNQEGEQKNKWCSFYDFQGEAFGHVGMYFVTFDQGKLYLHERGDYANYSGTQYDVDVDIVINNDPEIVKMFMNILQESSSLWYAEDIITHPTASYPTGMQSQLIVNKWGLYEGQYRADFLRDQTDNSKEFTDIVDADERRVSALLRGRVLRGEVAVIKLRLQNPENYSILRQIITETKI